MTPQEQIRKMVDSLNKQPKMPTGGDSRTVAEAVNTSAIAKSQAIDRTKKLSNPIPSSKDANAATMKTPANNYKKLASTGLEEALGIGAGFGGFVKGMTHSDPARAPVLDVTQTREYRTAQEMARQGLKPLFGEDPNITLQRLEQEQANFDEQYRRMTNAPSPTEQRMLRDANRFSIRSVAR